MSESSWEVADRAANVLAPESAEFSSPDVADLGKALAMAVRGSFADGGGVDATARFWTRMATIPGLVLGRWLGQDVTPAVDVDAKDRRFTDPAWTGNPAFYSLRLAYAAAVAYTNEIVESGGLDERMLEKARVTAGLFQDALAPTNFLALNPAALKKAFETGGRSILDGTRNFLDDLINNSGRPRQVDTTPFVLGQNMAATPAKVVFRNDLMELLQYEPSTPQVHAVPILCSPPWINKYYVMDLSPGRSFVEWAVNHGRTVFMISYRNPGPEESDITMDDYLVSGPRQAMDVVQEITGTDTMDFVGLCLGGALTAITVAFLSAAGDTRIGSITLLNTLLDYSEPGVLGVFTDEATVARMEQKLAKEGYLKGESMAGTFDMLRANDLIFNYVVSNWLMGQQPPAFDILAWNSDSTRMPAKMHAFYLRHFYVENKLPKGELEIAGQLVNLGDIKSDTYVVGAENDHIVPWRSSYAATRLLSGSVRFVLSSGGHIAGIVNPPGPKGWYIAMDQDGDELPGSPDEWRQLAQHHSGSWWEDWADWAEARAGELIDPPRMGSDVHPVLYDGPGEYIHT
jgi:polyhydroxyalkanoate synthase subunit PhaC